jgi:hypothetical protein
MGEGLHEDDISSPPKSSDIRPGRFTLHLLVRDDKGISPLITQQCSFFFRSKARSSYP